MPEASRTEPTAAPAAERTSSSPAGPAVPTKGRSGTAVWWIRVTAVLAVAVTLVLMFGPFTRETIGGAAIAMMLVLIFAKVPIGIALCVPALLGLYALHGTRAVENLFGRLPYETVASWEFSVIPMFVFMGLLLWKSGVTERLYSSARHLLGWLPGGLGIGTNGAGAGLAAISGSTVGTIHALVRIGVPEMLRAGYDRRLAVGSVVIAGLPGQVIPPSIFLVIYAGLAQVPVGPQLIAGIVPGLLMAVCFALTILVLCLVRPGMDGGSRGSLRDVFTLNGLRSVLALWPVVVLIGAVLGGMYSGVATVTEAGAVGALGAVLLTLWYRRKDGPLSSVGDAAMETLKSMGSIFFLFVGAMALSRLVAVSGIGPGFATWVGDTGFGRWEFLLVLMAAYLVMGMFMDSLSVMLLTVPLLIPVLGDLGISPLWFGVFVVILAESALITPPVGVLAFIVHDIVKERSVNLGHDISLGDIFRGIAYFVPAVVLVCLLLILAPDLATFLTRGM